MISKNLISQLLFSFQGAFWNVAVITSTQLFFVFQQRNGGPKWTRTIDLTIIGRVL